MVPDRGPATSAVTIVLTVLATVFVGARFYTRAWLVRSVKQDDWWILAAWVVAVGFSASICVAVKYGLGEHKVDIPPDSFQSLRKAEYAFSILYNPALMLTKTSILVFYLSVMSKDVDPVFKWCNWLTLALVNAVGGALTLYTIFQCRPVSAGYEYPTPEGAKCADIVTLYLSSAPVNIITDIAILFLPMPILTGMRLPRKQKIILVVTFSFGAFVAVVDVVRIAYLQSAALNRLKVVKGNGAANSRIVEEDDFSWYASLSFMWSAVEVCLGIICACVPLLKPLFLRFMPRVIKSAGDETTSNGSIDLGPAPAPAPRRPVADLPKGSISMLNNPAAFRKPSVQEYTGDDAGDQMGFLNMLNGPPDEDERPPSGAADPQRLSRHSTNKTTASDFGFVKMTKNRNMLRLSNRQSVWPIAVVTVIFFLWGFAYGLLDSLNSRFQTVVGLTSGQALGLHACYYAGYLIGPLTLGRFILKRYGFKAVMMVGLAVYGCGTLVFWPSAVLTSYGAFIVSNFIVAFGLSCLEVAANPYIALCGPLEYAEVRLNISQAFQAIGTVCSPLLAQKVLFKNVLNAPSLVDVQWTYLGIALFVYALAIVFYYVPLPEATDEQLDEAADRRSAAYAARLGPWKVVYVTLAVGVFSQWCYVGLQECVGLNLQPLVLLIRPTSNLQPFDFQTVAHTVFMAGRFLTAFLNLVAKPRWVLLALYGGLIVCLALNMNLTGDAGAALAMLTFLFEAGIFSNTFATAMRGLGAHTKTGSAFMTAAISGGAVWPPVQWGVANARGLKYSYCVPLAVAAFGTLFPVYLNLVPAARTQVDPIYARRACRRAAAANEAVTPDDDSAPSARRRWSKGIVFARKPRPRSDVSSSEHVEDRSRQAPTTPVPTSFLAMEWGDEKPAVQLGHPRGYVGELSAWPDGEASGSSRDSETREDGDAHAAAGGLGKKGSPDEAGPRRHRPVWRDAEQGGDDDGDDDLDDYHAVMRKRQF